MLGHEFVGLVDAVHDAAAERWGGQRVVGEINVVPDPDAPLYGIEAAEADPTLVRNHAPDRTCLGIVGKDGAHAEYLTLPLRNLLAVPDGVSDSAAVFCEPLAAACRIVEQGLVGESDRVAIVGDGKLGLLIAEVLGRQPLRQPPTLFGRHERKMALVSELCTKRTVPQEGADGVADDFDVVVESSGSVDGKRAAPTHPVFIPQRLS